MDRIHSLWNEVLPAQAHRPQAEATLLWLIDQYEQPWRAYHTLSHLERMFDVWKTVAINVPVADPTGTDPGLQSGSTMRSTNRSCNSDNEEQSAEQALI